MSSQGPKQNRNLVVEAFQNHRVKNHIEVIRYPDSNDTYTMIAISPKEMGVEAGTANRALINIADQCKSNNIRAFHLDPQMEEMQEIFLQYKKKYNLAADAQILIVNDSQLRKIDPENSQLFENFVNQFVKQLKPKLDSQKNRNLENPAVNTKANPIYGRPPKNLKENNSESIYGRVRLESPQKNPAQESGPSIKLSEIPIPANTGQNDKKSEVKAETKAESKISPKKVLNALIKTPLKKAKDKLEKIGKSKPKSTTKNKAKTTNSEKNDRAVAVNADVTKGNANYGKIPNVNDTSGNYGPIPTVSPVENRTENQNRHKAIVQPTAEKTPSKIEQGSAEKDDKKSSMRNPKFK